MIRMSKWMLTAAFLAWAWVPAVAWGPTTQLAVVTTAVHVLSQDGSIPLTKLERYVREGARSTDQIKAELFPNFTVDPVGTIQSEMYLLQSVRGNRVDPYYAYRLGALGTLVASATAPMASGNASVQRAYYRDVERHIERTQMRLSDRRLVDPQTYFARARREAATQEDTMVKDYQTGIGFNGLARASLSIDASRSVSAVADTWYTILSTNVAYSNVSTSHMRDYTLASLKYFLDKGNRVEAQDTYSRVVALGLMSAEVREAIGDMYFEAEHHERAMAEYEAVLEERPGNNAVMKKVALYYEQVGDTALFEGKLVAAQEAFASAMAADKLHPTASRKLFKTEALIVERDARLAKAREAILSAQDLETSAEREALDRNFALAITRFRNAEEEYRQVSGEFAAEAKKAVLGLRNVSIRMKELKGELIMNAQSLSGSGFAYDARRLAQETEGVSEEALHSLTRLEFRQAVRGLEEELKAKLRSRP